MGWSLVIQLIRTHLWATLRAFAWRSSYSNSSSDFMPITSFLYENL